ncbi:hypothetical protein [Labrys miyagiensis]
MVTLAAAAPGLLTCGDAEILWRLAEAFRQTQRRDRTQDVYRYILTKCTDPGIRLATMQKAVESLTRSELDSLLVLGNGGTDGDEFRAIREGLARNSVAAASANREIAVAPNDIRLLQQMADAATSASDPLLLGQYFLDRDDARQAEHWYRLSYDRQASVLSAGGLASALLALERPADAEAVLAPWQNTDKQTRKAYLAAVSELLGVRPPPVLAPDVLTRMATAVATGRDVSSAQQFGWYAHTLKQDVTALRWFATALDWAPEEEASAYGFAVASRSLGRSDALRDVVKAWGNRSSRIRAMVDPVNANSGAQSGSQGQHARERASGRHPATSVVPARTP